MVAEKETLVRDSMRMMGLNEFAYWASWLLYYLVTIAVIASLCTGVLYATLFKYSSFLMVWLFFFSYGMSLFGYIVLLQAFFENARHCAIFTAVLYFGLTLATEIVEGSDVPMNNKLYASLVPQVVLSLCVPVLGAWEAVGIGLSAENAS